MVMVRSQGWTVKIEPCQPAITTAGTCKLSTTRDCAHVHRLRDHSRVARHARHRCAHGGKATSHDDTAPDARSSERRASAAPPTPGSKARCPATACPVSSRSDSGRQCRACRVNRNGGYRAQRPPAAPRGARHTRTDRRFSALFSMTMRAFCTRRDEHSAPVVLRARSARFAFLRAGSDLTDPAPAAGA